MGLRRFLPFASGAPAPVDRPYRPSWTERSERAAQLAEEHPEAADPLAFYRSLLAVQEPLSEHGSLPRWREAVAGPPGDGGPTLRLERLPLDDLADDMLRFAGDLLPACTEELTPVGRRLSRGGSDLAARVLEAFLSGDGMEAVAREVEGTAFQVGFFPRAFLQPVAEGLAGLASEREGRRAASDAAADGDAEADGGARTCPTCGHLPVTGLIVDEPEVEGRRRLVCSLCATAWPFPRLTCPACGETEAERLHHHVAETWPHLRVEDCASCSTYLKTADLREYGKAVPVVDDIASLELDLWADDQGLRKLCPNVVGI